MLYIIATDVIKDEIDISPSYLPPPGFKLVPIPTAFSLSGRQQQQQQQHQQHQLQHHYQQQQQKCDDEFDQVHDNKDRQQDRNERDSVKGEQEAIISDHKPH